MTTDAWGIDDGWLDTEGHWQPASPATIDAIRAAIGEPQGRPVWTVRPGAAHRLLGTCHLRLEDGTNLGEVTDLPPDVPMGIHELTPLDGGPVTTLLASPGRCHLPVGLREWGVAVQIPTTRSSDSWGIGDLADVRAVARWIASLGGQVLALSPLHAPTPVAPMSSSPYYPSSRRWRSPLLIRVDEVAEPTDEVVALGRQARALVAAPVVDRDACWALQRSALEIVWTDLADAPMPAFESWRAAQGPALEQWARFCALAERHGPSWRRWPEGLRHPDGPEVRRAADALAGRVAFHAWLQHVVEAQLDGAREAGVRLVQDLAVGVDPGGADSWAWQDGLADGFCIGAPPDSFQPDGQRWGLPPWNPWCLRDAGYRPLADLLRAAMLGGGGLRIDHVMGLSRVFWVPDGGRPADGAYVRFAGRELLDLVALESARAGAIVIGEDLGTVEPEFREELAVTGILSTRVVWFEDQPPEVWPAQALAMLTTHDLPTLAGMCSGADSPAPMRANLERLIGPVADRSVADVAVEVHAHLGASPAALAIATLEDVLAVGERPNVPGTTADERPNWSMALPMPVEALPGDAHAGAVLAALAAGRAN